MKTRKSVLFVTHEASRTGAPIMVLSFLQWLKRNTNLNFDVLIGRDGPLTSEFKSVTEAFTPRDLVEPAKFFGRYNLIYSNTVCNGLLLAPAAKSGASIVTHAHELDFGFDSIGARQLAEVVKQTDHFIACGEMVRERLTRRLLLAPEKITVQHEMIPMQTVLRRASCPNSESLRKQYDLPPEAFVLAGCGTLDMRKAPDLFVQVASALVNKVGGRQPLRFIWVGKVQDPGLRRILRWDLRRLGIQTHFRFVEELPNPHELLALSDVFCMTSREDPFPLVMLEAAALGKPVVAFQGTGGAGEFCEMGGGYAVPFLNVEAFAEACDDLRLNPGKRAAASQRAITLVRERFDVEVAAPRLWSTLENLLLNPPARSPHRAANTRVIDLIKEWPLEGTAGGFGGELRQAQEHANSGRRAEAIDAFSRALDLVVRTDDPDFVFEAILETASEMAPLDLKRATFLLEQAGELATKLNRPQPLREALLNIKPQRAVAHWSQPSRKSGLPASIIIPVLNNWKLTRDCWEAIQRTTDRAAREVIFVDNGSSDETSNELASLSDSGAAQVITNQANLGFARACNQGAQAAKGRRLVFLNNDTQVQPGWLDGLLQAAEPPDIGVVGAKLLFKDGTIQHAGIGFINGIPDHPFRHSPASAPEVNCARELDMVTGACMLVRRELFFQLGGFDEIYKNGVEDVDLCLRARWAGWKVIYEPRCLVYHLEGQTAGRFSHVPQNLEIFFNRWTGCFDTKMRLVPPAIPEIRASAESLLQNIGTTPDMGREVSVAWEGSFLDFGSLSHVNRELTKAIMELGGLRLSRVGSRVLANGYSAKPDLQLLARDINTRSPVGVDVTVRHGWPPNWSPVDQGVLVVIQPWEFGSLPADWVEKSAAVHEFWVPSEHVRHVYVESGIAAHKVHVVPNGINPALFNPSAKPLALAAKKTFKFLFVGGTLYRKGADLLLQAYLEAFTSADDVCLVIKDFGNRTVYAGQTLESAIKSAQAKPGAPEILYIDEEMNSDQLPGLYTACDCLVHPFRGEGFGLPILEAMACGLPVVVTANGAADDFTADDFSYRIPAVKKPLGGMVADMKLSGAGWLLEPDREALRSALRWVRDHPEEARSKGARAGTQVRANWTWSNAAAKIQVRLRAITSGQSDSLHPCAPSAPAHAQRLQAPECARLGSLQAATNLLEQHRLPEAWKAATGAILLRPHHPEAYLLLAKIAQAAGDCNSAKACAQRAGAIAPLWKPARRFLKSLRAGRSQPAWLVLPAALERGFPANPFTISVCLIARDEERFLGQCLESVRDIAAQIIVVDTGSSDRTKEIALACGAEVHDFKWSDDFSAARNEALKHATSDWILMLDADEELIDSNREALTRLVANHDVIAWRLPIVDVAREAEGCHYVPRLFRNAPGLFYVGRIHEQVFGSIEVRRAEWGLDNRLGDATLRHHGYTDEILKDRKKVERNLRLLEIAVREMPEEPHLVMNYGLELTRSGRVGEGLKQYEKAFRLMSRLPAAQVTPETREALLAQFTTQLIAAERYTDVIETLESPLAASAGLSANSHWALGLAFMKLGRYDGCAREMKQCLAKRNKPSLIPINKEINGVGPRHCLAIALANLGQPEAAVEAFREALADDPASYPIRLDHAKLLAQQCRPVEALQLLHSLVQEQPNETSGWVFGGQIALSQPGFLEVACDWTEQAVEHHPADQRVLSQRADALLLSSRCEDALTILRRLPLNGQPSNTARSILCAIASAESSTPPSAGLEQAASAEFIKCYQNLVKFGAADVVMRLNGSLDVLRELLPSATRLLDAAISQVQTSRA